jgi:hypothetical protein
MKPGMNLCEQVLLEKILNDPDCDRLREKYAADCLPPQDPRADLIDVQLRLARPEEGRSGTDAYLLSVREGELLRQYRDVWGEPVAGLVADYEFHRGFVELVRLPAGQFLERAEKLFSSAPILHLDLTAVGDAAGELFRSPYLSRIRSLSMNRCGLGDREIKILAQSPRLQNLQWLSLAYNRITREGIEALARASSRRRGAPGSLPLGSLVYVNLYGNPTDPTERYADDQGIVTDTWLPPEGVELEKKYGALPWLHRDGEGAHRRFPDRFELIDRLARQKREQKEWGRETLAAEVAAQNQAQYHY